MNISCSQYRAPFVDPYASFTAQHIWGCCELMHHDGIPCNHCRTWLEVLWFQLFGKSRPPEMFNGAWKFILWFILSGDRDRTWGNSIKLSQGRVRWVLGWWACSRLPRAPTCQSSRSICAVLSHTRFEFRVVLCGSGELDIIILVGLFQLGIFYEPMIKYIAVWRLPVQVLERATPSIDIKGVWEEGFGEAASWLHFPSTVSVGRGSFRRQSA